MKKKAIFKKILLGLLIVAVVLAVAYVLVRRLLDAMFTREEEQNKLVKRISA